MVSSPVHPAMKCVANDADSGEGLCRVIAPDDPVCKGVEARLLQEQTGPLIRAWNRSRAAKVGPPLHIDSCHQVQPSRCAAQTT